jgi:pyruvate kinase
MTQIIKAVEDSPLITVPQNTPQIKTKRLSLKRFVAMRHLMANAINAKAICTLTNSGYTANFSMETISLYLSFTSNKES